MAVSWAESAVAWVYLVEVRAVAQSIVEEDEHAVDFIIHRWAVINGQHLAMMKKAEASARG